MFDNTLIATTYFAFFRSTCRDIYQWVSDAMLVITMSCLFLLPCVSR